MQYSYSFINGSQDEMFEVGRLTVDHEPWNFRMQCLGVQRDEGLHVVVSVWASPRVCVSVCWLVVC